MPRSWNVAQIEFCASNMKQPVLLVGLGYSSQAPLDMSKETKGIFEALSNKAKVEFLPNLTFDNLRNRFNKSDDASKISMFHYLGHSTLKGIQAEDKGTVKMIDAQFFSVLLANQKLKFIFLNSCFSKDIAKTLHDLGVPVVIGTSANIGNSDASLVATLFYEYLGGLNGSQTLINAFHLTTNELQKLQKENKLSKNYIFRGFGTDEDETQDFAWNIYAEKATETDKNWCLIPPKNYKLSSAAPGTQKKVFCLYDKGLKEYYEPFSLHGFNELDALVNGIWDISEDDPTTEDIVREWEAADCIIHLLDSGYARLQSFLDQISPAQFQKTHLFINIDNQPLIVDWLKTKNIYEEARLFPSTQNWIKNLGNVRSLSELKRVMPDFADPLKSFQNVLLSDLKPFFSSGLTPEQIGRELEQFDFEEEKKSYKADTSKLFFTLIEGTSDCAQPLLVKLIKNRVGIKPNVNIQVLKISGNPSIANEFQFGFELVKLLQVIPNDPNFIKLCAKTLLDRAEASVLVFDHVESGSKDLYQNQIINGLWNELIAEYQNRLQVPGFVLKHSIMIFVLNYETTGLPMPADSGLNTIQTDRKSPLTPFSKEEFNTWYGVRSQNSVFKGLDIERANIENKPRRKAMLEICKILHCDPSIIDTQVLRLS